MQDRSEWAAEGGKLEERAVHHQALSFATQEGGAGDSWEFQCAAHPNGASADYNLVSSWYPRLVDSSDL